MVKWHKYFTMANANNVYVSIVCVFPLMACVLTERVLEGSTKPHKFQNNSRVLGKQPFRGINSKLLISFPAEKHIQVFK